MIQKVSNISFEGKFHFNGYSKHTPKTRPYREFEFMPELQDKNPIKELCKKIFAGIKNIFKQTEKENLEHVETYRCTTIEM